MQNKHDKNTYFCSWQSSQHLFCNVNSGFSFQHQIIHKGYFDKHQQFIEAETIGEFKNAWPIFAFSRTLASIEILLDSDKCVFADTRKNDLRKLMIINNITENIIKLMWRRLGSLTPLFPQCCPQFLKTPTDCLLLILLLLTIHRCTSMHIQNFGYIRIFRYIMNIQIRMNIEIPMNIIQIHMTIRIHRNIIQIHMNIQTHMNIIQIHMNVIHHHHHIRLTSVTPKHTRYFRHPR